MINYPLVLSTLIFLSSHAGICPNHDQLHAGARFQSIRYTETMAEMSFQINFNGHSRRLYFKLPAHPPFTRVASDRYVSNSSAWNRGNVNWGMTERYKNDYADVLMNYVAFRDAYDHAGRIDCVYLSILENNYLYGHLWID